MNEPSKIIKELLFNVKNNSKNAKHEIKNKTKTRKKITKSIIFVWLVIPKFNCGIKHSHYI